MNKIVEILSQVSMFKAVPQVSLAELVRLAPVVRFKEGDSAQKQQQRRQGAAGEAGRRSKL